MSIYFLNEENQSIKDVPIHIDKDTIENQSAVLSANKEYAKNSKGGRRAKSMLDKTYNDRNGKNNIDDGHGGRYISVSQAKRWIHDFANTNRNNLSYDLMGGERMLSNLKSNLSSAINSHKNEVKGIKPVGKVRPPKAPSVRNIK